MPALSGHQPGKTTHGVCGWGNGRGNELFGSRKLRILRGSSRTRRLLDELVSGQGMPFGGIGLIYHYGSSKNRVGEPSFRFLFPSFVRRGEGEVAASHCHGRPNFPMAIKMRTNPRLYPTSILPLQSGGRAEGLLSPRKSEGRFETR